MIKDILRQIVLQQKVELVLADEFVRRDILDRVMASFNDNRIIILTGIRRCGKSTLLRQIMQNKTEYCYVNFEDERFIDFRAQDFELLNEVLIETYGSPQIYFFDEIQNIERFETFVRRLQDQGKKIVITGSNAALLSREFGTRLTGRYKSFEVFPFSFREYLLFKKVKYEKGMLYAVEKKVGLIKLFEAYLLQGGFPEYLKNKDKDYIRTIYENILYRDIIARHAIRRQKVLRELANILVTNVASTVTYNSLRKDIGLANAITVKEYISYLSNAYLFFELLRFEFSIRRQIGAPKKIYLVDSVFNLIAGLNFSPNKGRLLENVVFLELKRANREFYYYSGSNECDFLVKDGTKVKAAIQVCFSLNDKNSKREINGLVEVMKRFGLKNGLLLTNEQEEELKVVNKKIRILPVWKWLLSEI